MRRCWLLLAGLFAASPAFAASEPAHTDHLVSRLVAETDAAIPGQPLRLGLHLVHDPHWHTYWINSGDSGLATRITWFLPAGYRAGGIEWPRPERLPVGPLMNHGYSGTVVLPVTLTVPPDLKPGTDVVLSAGASWLICEVECIPGDAQYTLTLPVRERAERDSRWAADFDLAAKRRPREARAASARFAVAGERVAIAFAGSALPGDPASWTLFPVTEQIVANAATPAWSRTADGWRAVLPISDSWAGAPARFDLVLASGDEAIALSATPEPARVPASAAAIRQSGPEQPGLFLALGLAFLGGLILNLMPCVFPILSLKALGAVEAGEDARALRRHALLYALGVVASFVAVALLLMALRAGGGALLWGFQLQEPGFVAAMAMLFFALALSLSGVYEFGAGFAGSGQSLTEGGSDRSAFFTGVLACVVASPCTAPFMGSALGFALAQPALVALPVFAMLGLGMATPMLLLGYVPALGRRLPRPGPWMERLKQILAFPLYLTVVWLAWVYGVQTSALGMAWLLVALVVLALALWLLATARGRIGRAIAALVLVLAIAVPYARQDEAAQPAMAGAAEAFTEARLAELRAAGSPVFVNMTAAWCITCLANEQVALGSDRFAELLDRHGVAYLKGDWTRRDDTITRFLESFGRSGVPLYVLYPGDGREPAVLPQLLTPGIVDEAFAVLADETTP